jgi:hypothetical protein
MGSGIRCISVAEIMLKTWFLQLNLTGLFHSTIYILLLFLCFSQNLLADDDDPDEVKSKPGSNNQSIMVLDKATQAISGLKTVKLKPASYRSELLSYGMAISIEPLLAIQNQYLNALAQERSAQAKLAFAQNHLNRLSYLHREQIISTHALQDQQASLQADKAVLNSNDYLKQQIINNAQLVWGEKITSWLLHKTNPALTALIRQQSSLLKITFPPESGITRLLATIFVAPTADRTQATMAELISAAPQTDAFSQGQQYFYQTDSKRIKAGMRVSAWIPNQQHSQSGVIVPISAVVWHLGQAFIFVKIGAEQFTHRPLLNYSKISHGYFVNAPADEEVVVTGAQMLLSQQFKGQIPSEDDD